MFIVYKFLRIRHNYIDFLYLLNFPAPSNFGKPSEKIIH